MAPVLSPLLNMHVQCSICISCLPVLLQGKKPQPAHTEADESEEEAAKEEEEKVVEG